MKTMKRAASFLLLLGVAAAPEAFAQSSAPNPPSTAAPAAQTQRLMRPNRSVEITEARPGTWVNGTPQKPIFSGSMPIYPEAYDYVPAKGQ